MGKVDILLEILKPPTAAKAVTLDDLTSSLLPESLAGSYFVNGTSFDMEFRDRPTRENMSSYDFYGNSVGRSQETKSRGNRVRFNEHELFVAALESNARRRKMEDVGEEEEEEFNPYDKGCMFEFGEYIKSLFGCAGSQATSSEEVREVDTLTMSVADADLRRTALEYELRQQLIDIQRQKYEMECAYREEIARELSEKVTREAKIQARLLSIIENRVNAEIKLGQLYVPGDSIDIDNTPTVVGTPVGSPVHQHEETGSDKFRHLRELMTPHTSLFSESNAHKIRLELEAPAVEAKAELPFSPTHHYSPANINAKKMSFFDDADSDAVAKPARTKKNKKGPSLSIVTEDDAEMSQIPDENLPTATPVHQERGVIEVAE